MDSKLILGALAFFLAIALLGCVGLPPISPPASTELTCASTDPAKLNVRASDVSSSGTAGGTLGEIRVMNITGSDLSNFACVGKGAFAATVEGCPTDSVLVGTDIVLEPAARSTGTYEEASIDLQYTDAFGLNRSATIRCSPIGSILIS